MKQNCIIKTKKTMLILRKTDMVIVLEGFIRSVDVNLLSIINKSQPKVQEEAAFAASNEVREFKFRKKL